MVTISWQAKEWYGIHIRSSGYLNQIHELKEWCDNNNRHLVIRDWSFIDFTPSVLNNYCPANVSTSYQLLQERFELNTMGFVRDAIDVGLSRGGDFDEFVKAYDNYIEYILAHNITLFKYEDFCKNPNKVLQDIGRHLKFPIQSGLDAKCNNYRVIGDTNASRGNMMTSIVELKRKYALPYIRRKINSNAMISQINCKLGYQDQYESVNTETMMDVLLYLIKKYCLRRRG